MTYQRREDGLLVQEVGGELVVYDQERDRIHSLNPTLALVWRHCDGQRSITAIATLLAQRLGLPADEDLVWLALEQLEKAHLLQAHPSHATDAGKVSRREVVRKLAFGGSLVLLLPVIDSITAPTPAMASTPPNGDGNGDGDCDEDSFNDCGRGCADAQQECIDSGFDPESCMMSGAACTERCCEAAGCKGGIC